MRTFSVVTTFNQKGLDLYGQQMIDSFVANWPEEVILYVYAENCKPVVEASNVIVRDLHTNCQPLVTFKQKWKNVPKANGDMSDDPIRSKLLEKRGNSYHGRGSLWDAVTYSNKVYAMCCCAKSCDADVLLWMDADTICHSTITLDVLNILIPESADLCLVDRRKKSPETGLYSVNLQSTNGKNFLSEFQKVYDEAEDGIFTMKKWRDDFVFGVVKNRINPNQFNWTPEHAMLERSPLASTLWTSYIDHLKGNRKLELKRSIK